MEQTLSSQSSPVTTQLSRKRRLLSKSKVIKWKWKKDYKWKKTIKKPSRDRVEVHQIRVDVASYQEFQGLHQKYVTQKAVPVSFNVSDDLDSESYGKIVKDLLDSNFSKEVLRRDKIECPRANHHPKPTTPCCTTLEEIKKVYGVMGRFCCPTIYLVNTPEDNKLYDKILEFVRYVGLRPSVIYLDPIEDSPLSLPRLSSKRTKPSSHTRRRLYNDPVFSLKVNHLPSLLVNKKKPSMKGHRSRVRVKSYLDFEILLDDCVTKNAAPVSFILNHSVDNYRKILFDLGLSNSKWDRRDKIKNPRPGYCDYPITCSSVERMKAAYNVYGRHWEVIMRPQPDYGDCKKAKLLAEMRKFQLKHGINIHSTAPSRKKSTKTRVNVSVASLDDFKHLLQKYANNADPVSFNVSKDVDTTSYGEILEALLASNSQRKRSDKIKHPRSDHFPRPVRTCETTEEMRNVYNAIGPCWRVVMLACPEKNPNLFLQMDLYRMATGIEDHQSDPF